MEISIKITVIFRKISAGKFPAIYFLER